MEGLFKGAAMNNQEFIIEISNSCNRSKKSLLVKSKEYNAIEDPLNQFYRAGASQNINPCQALIGMATKHFTSISDMVKNPNKYSIRKWNEKITDLRNYTIILDALLRDMKVGEKDIHYE